MKPIKTFDELRQALFKTMLRATAMSKHEVIGAITSFMMESEYYYKVHLMNVARSVTEAAERVRKEKGK